MLLAEKSVSVLKPSILLKNPSGENATTFLSSMDALGNFFKTEKLTCSTSIFADMWPLSSSTRYRLTSSS